MTSSDDPIPGGACTLSKRPGIAGPLGGAYPQTAEDMDGTWVDWTSALGAVTMRVPDNVRWHPPRSLPVRDEQLYAQELIAALPHVEQVKCASTGTEVCMAAMATARAATGRRVILTSDQSYHGWSDQARAVKQERPGVPDPMAGWIATFRYNDLDALDQALGAHAGHVAAVMMEPTLAEPPASDFLRQVRLKTHAAGGLLIFDEMLLGGRLALGGGSEYFGVPPDLCTYGKAFGGGFPLGILAGTREAMAHSLFMSGTHCGHPMAMAFGRVTLEAYCTQRVVERLWRIGEALVEAIRAAIAATGAPLTTLGYPILPILRWTVPDPGLLRMSVLQEILASHKVLIHASGRLLPHLDHEDDLAILRTSHALMDALTRIHAATTDHDLLALLPGKRAVQPSTVRNEPAWALKGIS